MKYTIQRPATYWLEVVIDEADSLEDAIEQADEMFENGDYSELDGTFDIDYDRYWTQDEKGKVSHV